MRKNAYEANEGHILGVMVHSASVAAIVRDFSARERINCHICVTTHESALDDAAALLARGCEVLVCHGGSREAIYCQYSQQTVFIERSDMDLLKALLKAGKETREVILTAHETERHDIALMESLTGMHIHDVRYMDQRTLERKLAALIRKGVRVAVGGGA
ncbi:PrpR N-terminal domain-containing protein, partial [uncultured Desulfovibrio sp.]